MAQANDQQMQQFANERIRVRAEQFRAIVNAMRDDKAAIDDVYDRAENGAAEERQAGRVTARPSANLLSVR